MAEAGLIAIATPKLEKGIGKVILTSESADLIAGVVVKPFPLWPDDRGYFLEVGRIGKGLIAAFPADSTQISAALSYPGTIKAFHYPDLESLKNHVLAFVSAYNFAKHLKALRWKTPFEAICHASTTTPDIFKLNPPHLIPGPNT